MAKPTPFQVLPLRSTIVHDRTLSWPTSFFESSTLDIYSAKVVCIHNMWQQLPCAIKDQLQRNFSLAKLVTNEYECLLSNLASAAVLVIIWCFTVGYNFRSQRYFLLKGRLTQACTNGRTLGTGIMSGTAGVSAFGEHWRVHEWDYFFSRGGDRLPRFGRLDWASPDFLSCIQRIGIKIHRRLRYYLMWILSAAV